MLLAMRDNELYRAIPCIIMSSIPETAVRLHIDGYAGFIRKPFNLAAVAQLVATVLGSCK
jgi:hypothetical protein